MPKPRSGELLIKVAAAPINPSDYGVWRNSKPERCPLAIGNEGSGVVVASGGGSARIVAGVGTKVALTLSPNPKPKPNPNPNPNPNPSPSPSPHTNPNPGWLRQPA